MCFVKELDLYSLMMHRIENSLRLHSIRRELISVRYSLNVGMCFICVWHGALAMRVEVFV